MGQEDSSKKGRGGKHFTYEQRVKMDTLARMMWPHGKKVNYAELGRLMDKSRTAVRREFRRGEVENKDSEERRFPAYSAEKGRQEASARGSQKGPRMRLTNRVAALLAALITGRSLSPYAARAILLREGVAGLPCVRSIYYAVESGDLGITRESLPYKRRGRKKSVRGRRMAYTNRTGKSITDRPPEAETRDEYGHWEMDTVVGGVGASPFCLLVLTERMTRSQIIVRLPDRTQKSVVRALDRLERSTPGLFGHMRSLTCDNGCEFIDFLLLCLCGGSSAERFSRESVHPVLDVLDPFERVGSDVGPLGDEAADDAVSILVSTAFEGTVGVGEVKVSA